MIRLHTHTSFVYRNLERVTLHNCETSIEYIKFWLAAVSMHKLAHEGSSANIQIVSIPNVYYFSQEGLYNILIIDLLGPSLEDVFDNCNRRFSTKAVGMVAKQMVSSRLSPVNILCLLYVALENSNNPRKEPHLP
jgi:hypothetical protein